MRRSAIQRSRVHRRSLRSLSLWPDAILAQVRRRLACGTNSGSLLDLGYPDCVKVFRFSRPQPPCLVVGGVETPLLEPVPPVSFRQAQPIRVGRTETGGAGVSREPAFLGS